MLMSLFYYMCVGLGSTSAGFAESANDFWIAKIRKEHPRLFFNKDTWPQVRERALHQEEDWYVSLKKRVDSNSFVKPHGIVLDVGCGRGFNWWRNWWHSFPIFTRWNYLDSSWSDCRCGNPTNARADGK